MASWDHRDPGLTSGRSYASSGDRVALEEGEATAPVIESWLSPSRCDPGVQAALHPLRGPRARGWLLFAGGAPQGVEEPPRSMGDAERGGGSAQPACAMLSYLWIKSPLPCSPGSAAGTAGTGNEEPVFVAYNTRLTAPAPRSRIATYACNSPRGPVAPVGLPCGRIGQGASRRSVWNRVLSSTWHTNCEIGIRNTRPGTRGRGPAARGIYVRVTRRLFRLGECKLRACHGAFL